MGPIAHIGVPQGRALVIENHKTDSLSHEQRHSILVWWVRMDRKSGGRGTTQRRTEMEERERGRQVKKLYKLTGMCDPHGIHVYGTRMWPEKRRTTVTLVVPPSARTELVTTVTQGNWRHYIRHFDP
jgi:hypothetical protein